MSTRKNRHGAALLAGMESGQQTRDLPDEAISRPMQGNWSRQALSETKRQLADANEEAVRANERHLEGILEGEIPLRIPADQIVDEVGTDRVDPKAYDPEDPEFQALVENIRTRGLRTPIRVRNVDHDWRPDPRFPRDVTGQRFALQSGRRRLEACQILGIEPLCFLSFTDAASKRMEDLQERYFENTARRDLSPFERLLSIGMIAAELGDVSQAQIGEILGVSRPIVNRGLAVLELRDVIVSRLDPSSATMHEIINVISETREAAGQKPAPTPDAQRKREARQRAASSAAKGRAPALPFRRKAIKGGTVSLAEKGRSRVLSFESKSLDDATIEKILALLEELG